MGRGVPANDAAAFARPGLAATAPGVTLAPGLGHGGPGPGRRTARTPGAARGKQDTGTHLCPKLQDPGALSREQAVLAASRLLLELRCNTPSLYTTLHHRVKQGVQCDGWRESHLIDRRNVSRAIVQEANGLQDKQARKTASGEPLRPVIER